MQIELDSELNYQAPKRGVEPVIYVPLNMAKLRDPSIIDAF